MCCGTFFPLVQPQTYHTTVPHLVGFVAVGQILPRKVAQLGDQCVRSQDLAGTIGNAPSFVCWEVDLSELAN